MSFLLILVLGSLHASGQDTPKSTEVGATPSILIFSKGFTCIHCSQQFEKYAALKAELRTYGVNVTFVVPPDDASATNLTLVNGEPISIVVDSENQLKRRYADVMKSADHGTLVINHEGNVKWSHSGVLPFMNAALVLSTAVSEDFGIEIEINNTSEIVDDYLTWAPTPARIRASKVPHGSNSIVVVLTNDAERPVPDGRDLPLDGNVVFADTLETGHTADQPILTRRLPASGDWVPFYVAGDFPRSSTRDKDAVIEVHLDNAGGPLVGSHAMMIRVRKNIDQLTLEEERSFVKALHDLHVARKGYERFPIVHDLAAKGKEDYFPFNPDGTPHPKYYPDQAHRGAAFLPWHRAFLLQFERDLQKINPAVTIPYWRQNVATRAFGTHLLGTNRHPFDGVFQTEVVLSPANWLYGWNITYHDLKTLVRLPKDHSLLRRPNGLTLRGDTDFFEPTVQPFPTYEDFHSQLETDPHNRGHFLIGAWHTNCLISPSDPSFWSFHAEDDRLWAKWQWFHDRFDTTGTDLATYHFNNTFQSNSDAVTFLGHNLKDTMWPWDGTMGTVQPDAKGKGRRPAENTFGPFKKAPISGLWPELDAQPAPADVIDYLGLGAGRLPHGVCYDDVPFGVREPSPPSPIRPENLAIADLLSEIALDSNATLDRRSKALNLIGMESPNPEAEAVFDAVAASRESPRDLRRLATARLFEFRPERGVARLLASIDIKGTDASLLKEIAVEVAPLVHLSRISPEQRIRFHELLVETSADERDPTLAANASIALARMDDAIGIQRVKTLLSAKTSPPVPRAELASALIENLSDSAPLLRDLLVLALQNNDEDTAIIVLRALAGDADSRDLRLQTISSPLAVPRVSRAALRSLMREKESLPKALEFIETLPSNNDPLKLESVGVFRVAVESLKPFPADQVAAWMTKIRAVRATVPDTSLEMLQSLDMTIEVLNYASE